MNVERLTNRELDVLVRVLTVEATRRLDERRAAVAATTPPKGHGGRILAIEGDERLVECAECRSSFRCPRRRGRAPRTCPTCREARPAAPGAHRTVPADPLTHDLLDRSPAPVQRRFAAVVRRRTAA